MADFLEFSSFDYQFIKRFTQCAGDGVCRVQIGSSLATFQQPDVGLMQASQPRQRRPAQTVFLAELRDHPGEGV